jgi:hypothetical protein
MSDFLFNGRASIQMVFILSSPRSDSIRKHPFANRVESAEKPALTFKKLRFDL